MIYPTIPLQASGTVWHGMRSSAAAKINSRIASYEKCVIEPARQTDRQTVGLSVSKVQKKNKQKLSLFAVKVDKECNASFDLFAIKKVKL